METNGNVKRVFRKVVWIAAWIVKCPLKPTRRLKRFNERLCNHECPLNPLQTEPHINAGLYRFIRSSCSQLQFDQDRRLFKPS